MLDRHLQQQTNVVSLARCLQPEKAILAFEGMPLYGYVKMNEEERLWVAKRMTWDLALKLDLACCEALHADEVDFSNRDAQLVRLSKCASLTDIRSFWANIVRQYTDKITQQDTNAISSPVQLCYKVINEQYRNPDFMLKSLAAQLHFSPNYLSKLLKAETGYSFNEALNNIRIKNAKILLSIPTYRIQEICDLVGLNDQRYFARMFKKAPA